MTVPPVLVARCEQYCRRRDILPGQLLGQGKDGSVWQTNWPSAVKIHLQPELYKRELLAYIRLAERDIALLAGFNVPRLIGADDDFLAIEMSIVFPPYLLDFASATLDAPPDLIEDEG